MVICKYYLTNSCNFGTQCKNEHINVATVVKSDAEAAIKGKQWMLSSYGPFKDKASLPNFEDQSFEEIRSLCYEAKHNGNLQALLPQLSQPAADASYKISMLCDLNNVNNNLLNMLVNLYNSGESTVSNPTSLSSGNPFAISSGVSSGGQSSSLFGNSSTTQQQNPFGSSLFGSTSTTPSSSIFGGSANKNTQGNFFGQQSTFGATAPSVFGGQSAFGQSASNSFGSSTFGQSSASPFSLGQIGAPAEPSKQSSIFGASQFQQTQNSIFGAPPSFSNQIQPTKPSLFSSASTNSIFGQNQNATPSGLFGQSTNTNQPANGLFSTFGASTQPQQSQSQSLFGSVTENKSIFGQSANTNQNVFGSNQQQINQNSNIFANALGQQQNNSQNVFGVPHQQEQQSVFHQSNSNTGGSNIFQNQTNAPGMGGSIFGGNNGFGQSEQISQSAYTKLQDLKPEDLESFKADAFVYGKIPIAPPPQELCV